jgi:amino acid transporter
VNISAAIFGLAFLLTAVGAWRLRRLEGPQRIRIFGGTPMVWAGILAASAFAVLAMYEPSRSSNEGLPIEYLVFLAWILLGILFWHGSRSRRERIAEDERRLLMMGEA